MIILRLCLHFVATSLSDAHHGDFVDREDELDVDVDVEFQFHEHDSVFAVVVDVLLLDAHSDSQQNKAKVKKEARFLVDDDRLETNKTFAVFLAYFCEMSRKIEKWNFVDVERESDRDVVDVEQVIEAPRCLEVVEKKAEALTRPNPWIEHGSCCCCSCFSRCCCYRNHCF